MVRQGMIFGGHNVNSNTNSTEALLQEILKNDNLSTVSAAIIAQMKRIEKTNLVKERFGEFKPYTKKVNGNTIEYWRASFIWDGKLKTVTEKTVEGLTDKLYSLLQESAFTCDYTVEELFRYALNERKELEIVQQGTLDYYIITWNEFFKGTSFSEMKAKEVKVSDIKKFFESKCGTGKITRKKFNRLKSLANMIFDAGVANDLISFNPSRVCPTKNLKFKLPVNHSKDIYTSEERAILLDYLCSLPQDIYVLSIRLAFCFCMRIGELRALTWDDYDEKNGLIHIWHEIVKRPHNGHKKCDTDVPHTKANNVEGERWVYVSDEAKEVLKILRNLNGDKKYILNASGNAKYSVSPARFNEHLREYCTAAGVNYQPSHKIRFWGITELYKKNVSEAYIMQTAGHSNIETTRGYLRLSGHTGIDYETWNSTFGGWAKEG